MRNLIKIFTLVLILHTTDSLRQTRDNLIVNFQSDTLKIDSIDKNIAKSGLYFPIATRIDSNKCIGLDSFTNKWYSKHLKAMDEPVLYDGGFNKEIYRFTWLRTFDNPIMIRIERNNDSINLIYKVTNGAGGYEPGEIIIDKKKKLSTNEWNQFLKLVDSCNFWSTLPCEVLIEGTDGSQWILEGVTDRYYQVMDKWTPREGAYYNCCIYLIELTDLKFKKNEKY